ncbi:MAG: PQQ-dependent sugar dehydrogenase [Bacteroidota bacterium]
MSNLFPFKSGAVYSRAAVIIYWSFLFSVSVKAQNFPSGFSLVKVATIENATAMAFAPDGRLFVCQKDGRVRIIKNGSLLPAPFLTLTVHMDGERGISGIAFDPDFSTNKHVYIYYTATTPTIHNRLSRFTANGDVAVSGSEVALLDIETVTAVFHNGGGMAFGPDGKLYLSIGEDNKPSNSQNLSTYKGKLLRLNKDGSAPSDNPYFSSSSPVTKRIWCYGLRNPYTLSIQPGTGKVFVNDVGADAAEEINNGTSPGKNFGWPGAEGNSTNSAYTNPVFFYPHESTGQEGCAITGGTFFNPVSTNYPAQYAGKYFYMDYCKGWIYYINPTPPVNNTSFASGLGTKNLALQVGPDGNLYYLNRDDTKKGVYKIIYTSNNAPVITDHPDPVTVPEGQQAVFSVTASGATPLSYQWRKDGIDISGATSSAYTISNVQQSDAGQYSVRVTNSYGAATSNNAALTVTAFNASPSANILTPADGSFYRAGDTISFSGSGTDPEDGNLAPSALSWIIEFWHNNDHFHPGPVIPSGVAGGSFVIPNTGETSANVFYRIKLKATDSNGQSDTVHVDIVPRTSAVTINTQPSGLQITFDSQPKNTPFGTLTVEGLLIPIGVVSPQTSGNQSYIFDHWQHGGSASQTIKVGPGDSSYTAVYDDTVLACAATGTILREYWGNVVTSSLSGIPFNSSPSSSGQLTLFKGPSNTADNYGSRIRGYICPPQTGNYVFWIASDNQSELWLSTDNEPGNKVKIAYVSSWTQSQEWAKYTTQQSAPVHLIAGMKYYIEAIHREGTQGDHLAVGWQLPNGTKERPIPGSRLLPFEPAPNELLIPANSGWKYLDNGSNQGTAWRAPGFNDAPWKNGNAELGYGDGGEATVVSFGPSSSSKYITTYFRKSFTVVDASAYAGLELSLVRDDGAVVYLNGTEVYRSNMPSGTIFYNTLAPTYVDGSNESKFFVAQISSSALVDGTNVIAVEVHQNSPTSSDISFNLALSGVPGTRIMDTSAVTVTELPLQADSAQGYFLVYPNPTTGMFTLEFCVDEVKGDNVTVEIINQLGQTIYNKVFMQDNGCIREVIELDKSLPTGLYILDVITQGSKESKRIVLSR